MRISVLVKPGSSKGPLVLGPNEQGEYTVYLHARAHDGEANTELIKVLAKHFKVAKTEIELISGEKSRRKILEF